LETTGSNVTVYTILFLVNSKYTKPYILLLAALKM